MKKYSNLGELLIEYRKLNEISQHDFAASLDVDVRTIQRWEKNITLVKHEKEADLIEATFLPYQLIRNLNAVKPIPTFYDFRIRKYSLSELNNELPDVNSIKQSMDLSVDLIRNIDIQSDLHYVNRYIKSQYENMNIVSQDVLRQAILLLPNLNMLMVDLGGYYAGHILTLPISQQAFEKIRSRSLSNSELEISDLVDHRTQKKPIFYGYSITADSNSGAHYIMGLALKYFRNSNLKDYVYCSLTNRYDSAIMNSILGLQMIWEENQDMYKNQSLSPVRFIEGNFQDFFSK